MCHCMAYVKNYKLMGITNWSSEGRVNRDRVTEVNLVVELEIYGQANTCNFTCMIIFIILPFSTKLSTYHI